ncbi:hypothetical protein A4H97_14930 [Niastella yeongjuensis]|uniref:Uncharacterized protein n=1 Tax=Niastella yeongjuensis TaxID=354355 RepID=A0A1V9E438_9BACT|nr:hypothetical protein [Niastella yeongjuensis]OQP40897.1 hypothetical protein A4H97_14930 [Niastella yeongjuensis]SEO98510.1 hypothetical protein SAMN05660816_04064 [Niastella yeongjuensis]
MMKFDNTTKTKQTLWYKYRYYTVFYREAFTAKAFLKLCCVNAFALEIGIRKVLGASVANKSLRAE